MILDLSDLPSDPEQLKGKLIELASAAEEAAAQRDAALAENESPSGPCGRSLPFTPSRRASGLAARQAESKPLMEAFKTWAEERLKEVSTRSPLAAAIRYTLNHWQGLTVFLAEPRGTTTPWSAALRPIGLGRRNSLFAGSENGADTWAVLASLINTALLNDVDPQPWLTDVLERVVSGQTKSRQLAELLRWNWKTARAAPAQDLQMAA